MAAQQPREMVVAARIEHRTQTSEWRGNLRVFGGDYQVAGES